LFHCPPPPPTPSPCSLCPSGVMAMRAGWLAVSSEGLAAGKAPGSVLGLVRDWPQERLRSRPSGQLAAGKAPGSCSRSSEGLAAGKAPFLGLVRESPQTPFLGLVRESPQAPFLGLVRDWLQERLRSRTSEGLATGKAPGSVLGLVRDWPHERPQAPVLGLVRD